MNRKTDICIKSEGAQHSCHEFVELEKKAKNICLIRSISCLMVLLVHLGGYLFSSNVILSFVGFGAEGVRAFFVLSGYLCCFSVELKNGNIWKYYKKRARRILPVYYVVISVWLLYAIISKTWWPEDSSGLYWARYYLMLSTAVPSSHPEFWENLGATWSVSFFALYYLLAPLFYKYLNSLRKCLISMVMFLAGAAILIPEGYVLPVKGLYAFIIGMAIYYAQIERKVEITTAIFVILGLFFNLCGIAYPYGDTYLLSAVIICLLSMEKHIETGIFNIVVCFIDRHSYTIYLIHPLLINIISKSRLVDKGYIFVLIVLVLTVFISLGLDKLIERLFRKG